MMEIEQNGRRERKGDMILWVTRTLGWTGGPHREPFSLTADSAPHLCMFPSCFLTNEDGPGRKQGWVEWMHGVNPVSCGSTELGTNLGASWEVDESLMQDFKCGILAHQLLHPRLPPTSYLHHHPHHPLHHHSERHQQLLTKNAPCWILC